MELSVCVVACVCMLVVSHIACSCAMCMNCRHLSLCICM